MKILYKLQTGKTRLFVFILTFALSFSFSNEFFGQGGPCNCDDIIVGNTFLIKDGGSNCYEIAIGINPCPDNPAVAFQISFPDGLPDCLKKSFHFWNQLQNGSWNDLGIVDISLWDPPLLPIPFPVGTPLGMGYWRMCPEDGVFCPDGTEVRIILTIYLQDNTKCIKDTSIIVLKVINLDENHKFLTLSNNTPDFNFIPNPVGNLLNIQYGNSQDKSHTYGLTIIDLFGKELYNSGQMLYDALPRIVDLSTISSGQYFLVLQSDKRILKMKKLVVQK